MSLIRTDSSFSPGYSSPEFYRQRSVDSKNQLNNDTKILKDVLNSKSSVNVKAIDNKLRVSTIFNHNTNSAIGLVQSIISAAVIIENKLGDIRALAKKNGGEISQDIREIEESIIGIANDFSWNGIHYMAGKAGNNQETAPRKLVIKKTIEATSSLQMSFKSFNPISAVGTEHNLEPATWDHPNISKLEGPDAHAYGSAVLYSNLSNISHLDTHTRAMRDQTIIQISRAIDGIKREKVRLEVYLGQLGDIHKTIQNESLNRSNYMKQSMDVERAYKIAEFFKNKVSINLYEEYPMQKKINVSRLHGLVN
jgi:flagellin-like hook-associated protein FlgL